MPTARLDPRIWSSFHELINQDADELEQWLRSDRSRETEYATRGRESPGHRIGRELVKILRRSPGDLTAANVERIRTVVREIRCLRARRPEGDVVASHWRYALMNRGHDPLCRERERNRSVHRRASALPDWLDPHPAPTPPKHAGNAASQTPLSEWTPRRRSA